MKKISKKACFILSLIFIFSAYNLWAAADSSASDQKPELKFKADSTFKILLLADPHYIAIIDTMSLSIIEMFLDAEKPDMVIVNGDCLSGNEPRGNHTVDEVKAAIYNVGRAMEQRKVPWAITFGNHDNEHSETTHLSKEDVLDIYASYPYNINNDWQRGLHGAGNKNILIWDSARTKPAFCLWLLDSGDEDGPRWIHTDQVCWYYRTSEKLEQDYGRKIPGMMFFHIPIPEAFQMAVINKLIEPKPELEKRVRELVNGGIFAAVLDRRDVNGIFWGHFHQYNFMSEWMGVKMGFPGVIGYRGYPHLTPDYSAPDFSGYPEEIENDPKVKTTRSARIFLIKETDPENWESWIRLGDGSIKKDN